MNYESLNYMDLFGSSGSEETNSSCSGYNAIVGPPLKSKEIPPTENSVIEVVKGLQLIPDFFSMVEHDMLISELSSHYPHLCTRSSASHMNQAMYFPSNRHSKLPCWLSDIGDRVQANFSHSSNQQTQLNHVIVNTYSPGDGILPHVDLEKFSDGVAVLSLQSTLVMDLIDIGMISENNFCSVKVQDLSPCVNCDSVTVNQVDNEDMAILFDQPDIHWVTPKWIRVLLTPGSALLLEQDARWQWAHGIRSTTFDLWPADSKFTNWISFQRNYRISITIRHLIQN